MSRLEDTDVYTVERRPGGFFVRHFPGRHAELACCEIEVKPRGDETETITLRRAAAAVEKRHEKK